MKFRHHKYTFERPFMSDRHMWQLVGPDGGIHFTANITEGYGTSCGLEFHHAPSTGYRCDEAPDHINCWLIGGPCRHDGTSMYATDTLWPMIEPMLRSGDHATIWRFLEGEYDRHFADFTPSPATPARRAGMSSYWRSIDTAPEDQHVILATSGGHVGEAIMLIDEDTGKQKWAWALGPVHPNHEPYGWQPMPSAIDFPSAVRSSRRWF